MKLKFRGKSKLKFVIYPPLCSCCNVVLDVDRDYDNSFLCPRCLKEGRSGLELEKEIVFEQMNFENKEFEYLKNCISALEYNDFNKVLLSNLKFGYDRNVANSFIKIIEPYLEKNKHYFNDFDIITSVPLHNLRKRYRGFNQSELLGEQICIILNKQYYNDVLIKTVNTPPQTTVEKHKRQKNIENAFVVNSIYNIKGKKILLIDDIFTSGNTIEECARTLILQGVGEVSAFTLLKSSKNVEKD